MVLAQEAARALLEQIRAYSKVSEENAIIIAIPDSVNQSFNPSAIKQLLKGSATFSCCVDCQHMNCVAAKVSALKSQNNLEHFIESAVQKRLDTIITC